MTDAWQASSVRPSDGDYARGRKPGRTSTSRSFLLDERNTTYAGQPGRFVYRVFDEDGIAGELIREGEEWIVTSIRGSRTQVKVLIAREAGNVIDLWLQAVPVRGNPRTVLHLQRDDARRFADMMRRLELIEANGVDARSHVDDELVAEVLNNPDSASVLYGRQTDRVRLLIAGDEQAKDVVAAAGRRSALAEFEKLLLDEDYFESKAAQGNGPEGVWQTFFEDNPWTLGIGLGSQLLTSWSEDKLEQTVVGQSVDRAGKRTDALLRTSGIIRSMVFAEIKHHRTPLLRTAEYRSSIWAPSNELVGGVSQIQGTVHRAVAALGDRLASSDENGYETGDFTYLLRPRSFLIVGKLGELANSDGRHHPDKFRSFELYRRHLQEPEVVTFDELLARASWIVDSAV